MSKLLRFGLVGCGRIGATADDRAQIWPEELQHAWLPYAHASAIVAASGAELAAVCDISADAAHMIRDRFKAGAAYGDHREMIERERLDAVAIATRTAERPAITRDAVNHGIRAIYCEKPLATTLEAADEVGVLLTERSIAFGYGTRRRNMDAYLRARTYVKEGAIGELRSIVVKFGRGPLMWNHPHSVDIASFFADDVRVEAVQAELDLLGTSYRTLTDGMKLDVDPHILSARIRYANGIDATIVAADGHDVELIGAKGTLTVRSDGIALAWRLLDEAKRDNGWLLAEKLEPIVGQTSGTVRGIERLVALANAPDHNQHDELAAALAGHELLFAFVESHFAGSSWIKLPLERRGIEITGRVGDKFC